jgi:hypothetical protein
VHSEQPQKAEKKAKRCSKETSREAKEDYRLHEHEFSVYDVSIPAIITRLHASNDAPAAVSLHDPSWSDKLYATTALANSSKHATSSSSTNAVSVVVTDFRNATNDSDESCHGWIASLAKLPSGTKEEHEQ